MADVTYPDGTEDPSLGPAYYNRDMIGDSDGHKLGRLWGGTYTGGSFWMMTGGGA